MREVVEAMTYVPLPEDRILSIIAHIVTGIGVFANILLTVAVVKKSPRSVE